MATSVVQCVAACSGSTLRRPRSWSVGDGVPELVQGLVAIAGEEGVVGDAGRPDRNGAGVLSELTDEGVEKRGVEAPGTASRCAVRVDLCAAYGRGGPGRARAALDWFLDTCHGPR